jgi:hypothetical protein
MHNARLPGSPARITPHLLTSLLRSGGVICQSAVAALEIEPLAALNAFNAQIARLRLTYDREESAAPSALIAKLPTVDASLQQNAAVFRPGLKECWFYRHAAAKTPVHVPRCYYNAVDEATGESFLLLEDLAPARPGSRLEGASIEEARLALQSLARLHAAWWEAGPEIDPKLAQLGDHSQEADDLVGRLYARAWPRFVEHAPLSLPDDIRRFGESLLGRIARVESLLDDAPQTLIHGDFRLENMLFGTLQEQPACWVIDWEDIGLANGMLDAAWFLGGCLALEQVEQEEQLLRGYHRALTAAGVCGYSWEQCKKDYRFAMISSFVQGILTVVSLQATGGEHALRLADVLTGRWTAACQRLELYELSI